MNDQLFVAPLNMKTLRFTEGPANIEQLFIDYQNLQIYRLTKALKAFALFFGGVSLIHILRNGLQVNTISAVVLTIGFIAAWKMSKSERILQGNNAEKFVVAITCFTASVTVYSPLIQAPSLMVQQQHALTVKHTTFDECVASWTLMVFTLSIIPPLACIANIWVGMVRYSLFKICVWFTAATVLLRTSVFSTLPLSFNMSWVLFQGVILPLMFTGCARTIEIETRNLFWAQRFLRGLNEDLRIRLDAVEKALKFEAPTLDEQKVVERVLGRGGGAHRILSDNSNNVSSRSKEDSTGHSPFAGPVSANESDRRDAYDAYGGTTSASPPPPPPPPMINDIAFDN